MANPLWITIFCLYLRSGKDFSLPLNSPLKLPPPLHTTKQLLQQPTHKIEQVAYPKKSCPRRFPPLKIMFVEVLDCKILWRAPIWSDWREKVGGSGWARGKVAKGGASKCNHNKLRNSSDKTNATHTWPHASSRLAIETTKYSSTAENVSPKMAIKVVSFP